LQAVVLAERLLHRMQRRAVGGKPLDGLTSCPSAITASVVQDFTALPSRCTTQAPHCEVSQPTWVPVSRRFSRRNCTSSVRGSTWR